jgi:hypothetical protein
MGNAFRVWCDEHDYSQCKDRFGYHPGPCAGRPCTADGFLMPIELVRVFEHDRLPRILHGTR